jgi:hypothetical protein
MRPLAELPRAGLRGILCDIDDTLTDDGRLVPAAFAAMARAQAAGLRVVPVTGRPAGWVDLIARQWPVDGCVGENGGLWFWRGPRRLERRFAQPAAVRDENRARLDALAAEILAEVPGAALASDQRYRELDLAVDFCEDVPPLPDAEIDRIVAAFGRAGATCKVSSIHVNGWYGDFDKRAGFFAFHADRYGAPADPSEWVYIGDSANDAPMFRAFPASVGVANVRRWLPRMDPADWPRFVTPAEGGAGFAQLVDHLLGA